MNSLFEIQRRRFIQSVAPAPSGLTLDDAFGGYALKELFSIGWSKAFCWVRRSSDSGYAYVFFDGSGTVSLSSLISTTSDTTPDATSLGTWAGTDEIFVNELYMQKPDDSAIDSNFTMKQNNGGFQPTIMNSGAVTVDANGIPALLGDGASWLHQTSYVPFPHLADYQDWGIFDLASTNSPSQSFSVWSNLSRATGVEGNNSRICGWISKVIDGSLSLIRDDTLTNNRVVTSSIGGGSYVHRLAAHSHIAADKTLTSAIGNDYVDTNKFGVVTYSTGYQNDGFCLMAQLYRNSELGNGFWTGNIHFNQDITADRSSLYAEINALWGDVFD